MSTAPPTTSALVEPLFALWTNPPVDDAAALAAFRDLYHDPVTVNGIPFAAADLLVRARQVNQAYSELRIELIDTVSTPARFVVAFQISAGTPVRWPPRSAPSRRPGVRCAYARSTC